eukprot:916940-Pyramimonas_sp.AAC.1
MTRDGHQQCPVSDLPRRRDEGIETTVLKGDVPHILSVNLLEALECIINLPNDVMGSRILRAELPLARLGSGHRMAAIVQPPLGPEARPPASALKKYPFLKEDSFRLRGNVAPEMLDSGEVRECVLPFSSSSSSSSSSSASSSSCRYAGCSRLEQGLEGYCGVLGTATRRRILEF